MPRRKNDRPTLIYWLVDVRPEIVNRCPNGQPFYCGKTVNALRSRLVNHGHEARSGTRRAHVRVRECGEHLRIQLMETVPVDGDWGARETHWINLLRGLNPGACNANAGGAGMPGWIPSAETRAKFSAWQTGRKLSKEHRAKISAFLTGKKRSPESIEKGRLKMKGKRHTPEARANMSAAQKARGARGPHTAEHCAKISAANKGKKRTPETRARMSAGQKGKTLSPEHFLKLNSAESRAKAAAARIGKKRTPEQRARMSAAHLGKGWSQVRRDAYLRSKRS